MTVLLGVSLGTRSVRLAQPRPEHPSAISADASGLVTDIPRPLFFRNQLIDSSERDIAHLAAGSIGVVAESEPELATAVAYRDSRQADTVRDALVNSRLKNYHLVHEVQAVIEYLAATGDARDCTCVALFDLGASGLTVSVVDLVRREVIASRRTGEFSGDLFDDQLRNNQLARLGKPASDPDMELFEKRCRIAKERLSTQDAVCLPDDSGMILLSRDNFELLVGDLVDEAIEFARGVMIGAQVPIDAVVLIGGGARVPLVQQRVGPGLELPSYVPTEPETVAARGAALSARPHARSREASGPAPASTRPPASPVVPVVSDRPAPAPERPRSAPAPERPRNAPAPERPRSAVRPTPAPRPTPTDRTGAVAPGVAGSAAAAASVGGLGAEEGAQGPRLGGRTAASAHDGGLQNEGLQNEGLHNDQGVDSTDGRIDDAGPVAHSDDTERTAAFDVPGETARNVDTVVTATEGPVSEASASDDAGDEKPVPFQLKNVYWLDADYEDDDGEDDRTRARRKLRTGGVLALGLALIVGVSGFVLTQQNSPQVVDTSVTRSQTEAPAAPASQPAEPAPTPEAVLPPPPPPPEPVPTTTAPPVVEQETEAPSPPQQQQVPVQPQQTAPEPTFEQPAPAPPPPAPAPPPLIPGFPEFVIPGFPPPA